MSKVAKYVSLKDVNAVLREDTAAEYEVVNWSNKRTGFALKVKGFDVVNFRTVSPAKAKKLVSLGFPYLAKKEATKTTSKKD